MRRALITLAALLLPQQVLAQPPSAGSVETLLDPVYGGTVFCDTLEQVRSIAEADRPRDQYLKLLATTNHRNQPTCAAIIPTGLVMDVKPLSIMDREDKHFHAWAIKLQLGDQSTGYALYLEQFEELFV